MKKLKRVSVALLAFIIILSPAGIVASGPAADADAGGGQAGAPEAPATIRDKDEVVYARLSENGSVRGVYVVNHFSLDSGGIITDHGGYSSVLNLTDLQPLELGDGTVTVRTMSENFYYQGNLAENDLPWTYWIEYILDGEPIAPEHLAGRSGRLEIRVASAGNGAVNDVYYNNYMQQITITLDSDKCSGIKADGAVQANAGKSRMLVFTVLPKQDAVVTVTADVRDFTMTGIDITAMPFSMSFDIPDITDMLDDFTLLTAAITELKDGVGLLNDGIYEMSDGTALLRSGSSGFITGMRQLSANSALISDASEQINSALSLIASSVTDTGGMPDLSMLIRLPDFLTALADGLEQASDGMKKLKSGYEQAYAALDQAVADVGYKTGEKQISAEELNSLYVNAGGEERALLDILIESYTASVTVRETYDQVKPVLASVSGTLESLSAVIDVSAQLLGEISSQIGGVLEDYDITGQLEQLTGGLSELSRNYGEFHGGLVMFMQGVSDAADGYAQLDEGIAGLGRGALEMAAGAGELYSGTVRLADETAGMPGQIEAMADAIASDYAGAGFDPVSFTSEKNDCTVFVQFVFKTDGINIPSVEKGASVQTSQQGFLDRLTGLFIPQG